MVAEHESLKRAASVFDHALRRVAAGPLEEILNREANRRGEKYVRDTYMYRLMEAGFEFSDEDKAALSSKIGFFSLRPLHSSVFDKAAESEEGRSIISECISHAKNALKTLGIEGLENAKSHIEVEDPLAKEILRYHSISTEIEKAAYARYYLWKLAEGKKPLFPINLPLPPDFEKRMSETRKSIENIDSTELIEKLPKGGAQREPFVFLKFKDGRRIPVPYALLHASQGDLNKIRSSIKDELVHSVPYGPSLGELEPFIREIMGSKNFEFWKKIQKKLPTTHTVEIKMESEKNALGGSIQEKAGEIIGKLSREKINEMIDHYFAWRKSYGELYKFVPKE